MRTRMKTLVCIVLSFGFLLVTIGYAALADNMSVTGTADVAPSVHDVYITKITPTASTGITVRETIATTMFAGVSGNGTFTFTVDVINVSDKVYVFERVITGAETGLAGVYNGSDIQYTLSGISMLDEIAPNGGTLSFNVTVTVPRGVTTDNYVLIFNFVEKTGTEILPGNDEYDITFQYNDGRPTTTVKAHENEFVPRPETPVRSGYEFTGWYTDTTYSTAWNFEVDRVKGHMTLYAGWTASMATEYVVTFQPNNGESSRVTVVAAGALIALPATPVRDGYTFIGWYTDSSCTNAWNFDTDRVNANMILYGGWEVYVPPVPPELYISFDPNTGGEDTVTTVIVMTGDFIPRPATPVNPGYTFTGWYTEKECINAWNFEAQRPEGDMTLFGGWVVEEIVETPTYTVTFKPNNGTADSTISVEEGALIPRPETPQRAGYTFIGWYIDEACTVDWNFDTEKVSANMTLFGDWEKTVVSDDEMHNDFMGLVEALLSDSNNCLNHSDLIFDSVMESLTSKKRPKEDAPILHCSVNSVSGGTMSAIASYANSKLTANLHFIFEVDPDPAYRDSRMRLYMYYGNDCTNAKVGDTIMVYQQIVTRGSDGVWFADGTYIGKATVGNYFGGGNAGKDVKTISPYTWTYGYP